MQNKRRTIQNTYYTQAALMREAEKFMSKDGSTWMCVYPSCRATSSSCNDSYKDHLMNHITADYPEEDQEETTVVGDLEDLRDSSAPSQNGVGILSCELCSYTTRFKGYMANHFNAMHKFIDY